MKVLAASCGVRGTSCDTVSQNTVSHEVVGEGTVCGSSSPHVESVGPHVILYFKIQYHMRLSVKVGVIAEGGDETSASAGTRVPADAEIGGFLVRAQVME